MSPSLRHSREGSIGSSLFRGGLSNSERLRIAAQVRKEAMDKVHDDWTFDPDSENPPTYLGLDVDGASDSLGRDSHEEVKWVERTCSSSASASDSDAPVDRTSKGMFEAIWSPGSRKPSHVFEGPDSVGAYIQAKRRAKQKVVQHQLNEELVWNKGLQHWQKQRTAWSGGRPKRRSTYSMPEVPAKNPRRNVSAVSSTSTSDSVSVTSSDITNENEIDDLEEIPLAPPFISPNAPIRSSISPASHSQIYQKVVVRGLAPTIPINLKDVTAAIVQGWKEDGEWPPKPTAPEPHFTKKKSKGSDVKMGALEADATIKHPHLTRGVGAVKKALRLSGGSSSPTKDL